MSGIGDSATQDELATMKRASDFLADLVEVFKKHRVMIEPDDLEVPAHEVSFSEHANYGIFNFRIELPEIESAVREAVWPIVHP